MRREHDSVPWSAALLGTLPLASLAGITLARFLPLPEETRFVIGLCAIIPLWVSAICLITLCRRRAHAWLVCASASLLLGLLAFALPPAACTPHAAASSYSSQANAPSQPAPMETTTP